MSRMTRRRREDVRRRYSRCPINCLSYLDDEITSLGDFFSVFHALLDSSKIYWFRGQSQIGWRLAPSALRDPDIKRREKALSLITEAKRFLEIKMPRPPAVDDDLGWMQVAQHYGLPTCLLDWTQSAAVALFFACWEYPDENGLVAILNPLELNQSVDPSLPRVFNPQRGEDAKIILPYLGLGPGSSPRGKRTIAINPTWNTERIAMQNGVFTLHGSRTFDLDRHQASSLLYVPILKEHKAALLDELERVGMGEMFIFPEPEHVCSHLRRRELSR
jgi:hypothetical protein